MSKIEIYTKGYCPFCQKTKATLQKLGLAYEEYEITGNDKLRTEMVERSQRKTVPQVFIDDQHIGGSDDFHHALRSGALANIIAKSS